MDLQQPRLGVFRTVFPAAPTQFPRPVYRQQILQSQPQNQQQPQYPQRPYPTTLYEHQNQQPQNQQPSNQNVQIETPLQHRVIKYQPIPINTLAQAGEIERPIFFKPGSFQTTVYPPVQYYGKFAKAIFDERLNQ